MARLRIAALVLCCSPFAGLSSAAAPTPQPGPAATSAASPTPTPRFGDEIAVRLVTVVVRVVDGAGNPVLGLAPGDFHVRVGRHAVPVAAVDWIAGGDSAAAGQAAGRVPPGAEHPPETAAEPPAATPATEAPVAPAAGPASPAPATPPPGKLVVIFVQADNNAPSRTRGHLHTLPFTRELLAALAPEDQVAVVAFDSHLKLWQDFTRDRQPVPEAIYQAIRFGGRPPEAAADGVPSLVRHFDFDAARRAASPERALAVTAEALAALPGEKVLVFLAWGLGNFGSMGTHMTPAFAPAVRALTAAKTTVFVLDVTEADAHDLEIGLQGIAEATGGTYDKTNVFPALAVRQLARTISGYYVLTLDAATLPQRGGEVAVELRGRKGNVLLRPTSLPAAPAAPAGASR
jgi:VWFA-related protein